MTENEIFDKMLDARMDEYDELLAYRAISTIEEFKALKEKNEPKKAIFDNENEIYICSRCGKKVGEHQNYCWSCGQAFYT